MDQFEDQSADVSLEDSRATLISHLSSRPEEASERVSVAEASMGTDEGREGRRIKRPKISTTTTSGPSDSNIRESFANVPDGWYSGNSSASSAARDSIMMNREVDDALQTQRRLILINLPFDVTETSIKEIFSATADHPELSGFTVESVEIPLTPGSGDRAGYALVDLSTAAQAERAVSELTQLEILGRRVSIRLFNGNLSKNDMKRLKKSKAIRPSSKAEGEIGEDGSAADNMITDSIEPTVNPHDPATAVDSKCRSNPRCIHGFGFQPSVSYA